MTLIPRRTARLRLSALYGGLLLLSGVALVAATYVLFERATELRAPHLPRIPQAPSIQPLQLPQALANLELVQRQFAQDQHRLALSLPTLGAGLHPPTSLLRPQLAHDQQELSRDEHRLSHAVDQLAQAERQVTQAGSAQAAQRASDSHELLVDSGIALAVVAVLAILAGWLVAGRMLGPIRTITRTARRISSTSLHERLALDGPEDELKELGDTLDDLFARLEGAFEAQRRFVAHASHELRTPLTRERTLVQVALADPSTSQVWHSTGRELLASNRQQEALIDGLLTLASSESGLDQRQRTDLGDSCNSVLARPSPDGDRLGLRIETDISSAELDGDPTLIEHLVANLVENAVGHNVVGGRVRISTEASDGNAVLTVTNTGPVVDPAEIERLFQPFQRLEGRRLHHTNGHGLGLSIVRAIAGAHGATVTAEPLDEGGLKLSVAFPSPVSERPPALAGRRQPLRAQL
jgi:signal transduction histidine kinase